MDNLPRNYCPSRFGTLRRPTREVKIGSVPVGGTHPVVIQSMTTTPTLDVDATVRQCIALAEAGCEVIRITAQNSKAAKALKEIRRRLNEDGFQKIPLVADIHFLPQAAMEAVEHVEKVRINPGNYADKKKFEQKEYSDDDYNRELERLHEAFSPIVLRCKELGRAMRIGTNHGSLSDRILNRYGDTPLGMCESALEFIRIAESHGFRDIILSMKASNPKVMIQAYRLIVTKMDLENMHYPLHLGVTEAGDGDDARIKSAIGIGSLLLDGLGDTIRVSLTEDPVYEVPVARDLVRQMENRRTREPVRTSPDPLDPFSYQKRPIPSIEVSPKVRIGPLDPPTVIQTAPALGDCPDPARWLHKIAQIQDDLNEARMEGLLITGNPKDLAILADCMEINRVPVEYLIWDTDGIPEEEMDSFFASLPSSSFALRTITTVAGLKTFVSSAATNRIRPVLSVSPEILAQSDPGDLSGNLLSWITLDPSCIQNSLHPVGAWRQLHEVVHSLGLKNPLWLRHRREFVPHSEQSAFATVLLEASVFAGSLLCDGIGDALSVETVTDPIQSTTLAYNILQGARCRSTKTEYVACPSCGRTLFDLQSTTQSIRNATGHLKGVTIAVMGCIVNGPGEMADADFGYVGGAPGKVNLYVGKECVQYHIPAERAVEALINLIQRHGKWQDPPLSKECTHNLH